MKTMLLPENYFKALSDETRLRCMMLLYKEGELCVCELTTALELSQPKISRHLAQLRQSRLLVDNRSSQWVYYKINPELPAWALAVLSETEQAITEVEIYQQDRNRLHSVSSKLQNGCG
jgi:ArsR family transcriptional regulator, arsenate/arsenite/antimonite-responsive transcriptional repressor